jgi:hypothetical protein
MTRLHREGAAVPSLKPARGAAEDEEDIEDETADAPSGK